MARPACEEARLWFTVTFANSELNSNTTMVVPMIDRWQPPPHGTTKCNVNANWRNASLLGGGAWIARDANGQVLFHAREAFTPFLNRITAELCCILWTMQSLNDLHIHDVSIGTDCKQCSKLCQNLLPGLGIDLPWNTYLENVISFKVCVF